MHGSNAIAAVLAISCVGTRRANKVFGRSKTFCRAEVTATPEVSRKRPLLIQCDDGGDLRSLNITTPLFYANGSPHIGSAYPAISSDVMSRYGKLRGAEVHFVTGMDEHGEKIAQTAAGQEKTPQELVDGIASEFQELWDMLSVRHDHFARTTQARHKEIVAEMWGRCMAKGDIYMKNYTGWYCVGCEAYLDDDEMEPGHICKIHRKEAEYRTEENYFFRLSKYWDALKKHVHDNPDFILPRSRQSQILIWLDDDNKRDFSISRASTSWGIPCPGDDSQVIYVWFDALLGYLSSLLQPEDPATLDSALKRGWPADVHVIGKDIMRFHALYWPAMLMSADLPLPKHICTHGFLTKDGLKMGKSLGNVVEPVPLVQNFGTDAVRFFFASCLGFGEDGDFSYEVFIKRVNSALANELGNLSHRLLLLCRKSMDSPMSPLDLADEEVKKELETHPVRLIALETPALVAETYEQMHFSKAADLALRIVSKGNQRIMEVKPWNLIKEGEEEKTLALREMLVIAEGVRIAVVLLSPIIPDLSKRILDELGANSTGLTWKDTAWSWDALPGLAASTKPKPLFPRIEVEPWEGK